MDLGGLTNLSWREALMAAVVLLLLYVGVVYRRMRRLKRAKAEIDAPTVRDAKLAVAAYAAVQEPAIAPEPVPLAEPSDAAFPWNEPPGTPVEQKIETLERDINQLRKEVGGLRAEVLVLREALQRERVQVQATQSASPLYSDAMQMAMQGHDAATISQHCGISRAESELVVALVRNRDLQ